MNIFKFFNLLTKTCKCKTPKIKEHGLLYLGMIECEKCYGTVFQRDVR